MSKRLQVLLDENEFDEIRQIASNKNVTVAEWVRQVLREARLREPKIHKNQKLKAIRGAYKNTFPVADIEQMLAEIERGYITE